LVAKTQRIKTLDYRIEDIIEKCKSCDRLSQEKLYLVYSKKLFGISLRYAKNYDEAQDILHDAFIKIFQNIKQLKEVKAAEGWMKRIVINTALEHFRNMKNTEPIHEIRVLKQESPHEIESIVNEKDLLKLIQGLSPQYRMVFNLYAIEGYNHKEIGKMLKISEGTSKSDLSRARVILQEKVKILYNSSEIAQKDNE